MRVLVLCVALVAAGACGRRTTSTAPSPELPPLAATVVGPDGPVAGARVRLLALPAAPCPCTDSGLDPDRHYGNEMPSCACPAALAQWRARLATCDVARGFVAETTSDTHGRVRLERSRGVTSLDATTTGGVLWMRWPQVAGPIALALDDGLEPTIRITGAPAEDVRGAVLFEDGHCVPLARAGDAWKPRVPLPSFETAGGTLVIEAAGFATTVYSLFDQDEVDIELVPATPISGTCEGSTVKLQNPFQRLVAKVDDQQRFTIHGAIAVDATVECWKDAQTLVEEWTYSPGEPLGSAGIVNFSSGSCTDVMIVDAHNLPVANAEVSHMEPHGLTASGYSMTTNARGVVCLEYPSAGDTIEVVAPDGRCAGETNVTLTARHLAQTPIRVQLHIKPLGGTTLRGRVIDADGNPVAGAGVGVKDVSPANPDACSDLVAGATSAVDGTFEIASVPRGKVVLEAEHKWFLKRELTVVHDDSAHDIVLGRGGRWTGRILDPDGTLVRDCSIFLHLADGRLIHTNCHQGTFDLKPIVPGEAQIAVRLNNHALGTFRELNTKLRLDASIRQSDIQFPRGEHIRGRIVDKNGHAIPRGQLAALPKGTLRPGGRLHDDEIHVEADASGNFAFLHLTPGTWTLNGIGRTHTMTTIDVKTGTTDATFIVPSAK